MFDGRRTLAKGWSSPLDTLPIGFPPGRRRKLLTQRELDVAKLIAKGLTNHEIATALVISDRTAANHVQHILNKLGFRSRAQIAAWVVAQGLYDASEW